MKNYLYFLLSLTCLPSFAGWNAGTTNTGTPLGCIKSFEEAVAIVCANNNPDTTSRPGYAFYRDSCTPTVIPSFTVEAHMTEVATGISTPFTYTASLQACGCAPGQKETLPWTGPATNHCVPLEITTDDAKAPKPDGQCQGVANPIFPMKGTKVEKVGTGFSVGGYPLDITYDSGKRDISSADNLNNPSLGRAWVTSLHRSLYISSNLRLINAFRGDGSVITFTLIGGVYSAQDGRYSLSQVAESFLFNDRSAGLVESYSSSGVLTSLSDADGNQLTFNYSAAPTASAPAKGYLVKIVDSRGRFLNFEYALPTGEQDTSAGLVSRVTETTGQSLGFGYDAQRNLSTLTWPDGTARHFLYENTAFPWALTGILDEKGARFASWDYDSSGRALSSEHSGGVDRTVVTYGSPASATVEYAETYDPVADLIRQRRSLRFDPSTPTLVTYANGTVRFLSGELAGNMPTITGASQPAGSGCAASSSQSSLDANGNTTSRDSFQGDRSCFVHDSQNREITRVEGLPVAVSCSAVTPSGATLPVGARKITTQWHPDWNKKTIVNAPGVVTNIVYHGQPDRFNGNTLANCSSALALPNGKSLPVVCKVVTQATISPDGQIGANPGSVNTSLSLNFNGANGSQALIDWSSFARTGQMFGNAKLSNVDPKFGNASIIFPGAAGDYAQITAGEEYNFGTGDFAIEGWLKVASYPAARSAFLGKFTAWVSVLDFYMGLNPTGTMVFLAGDAIPIALTSNNTIPLNTWTHVAVSRVSGVTRMFISGVLQAASHTGSINISNRKPVLTLGQAGDNSEFFTGNLDGLVITKGLGKYVTSFAPQADEFSASSSSSQFTYDASGRVLTAKDNLGAITTYAYYAASAFNGVDPNATGHTIGDLQSITAPGRFITTYDLYDPAGRLLKMTDPKGVVTDITLDLTRFHGHRWTLGFRPRLFRALR